MHELSICQALIAQVERIATSHGAQSVELVKLRVGPLAGVEPLLLQHAYPFASAGTVAAGSTLVIEPVPLKVSCATCGAETEAEPNRLICGACGDYHTRLVSGDEMTLMSVGLIMSERGTDDV
ncbi:hydrogenase nickel incorporation protein HypA [Nitrosospira lacus]|uniref:Hydrogenase maturation factor HypA n=1 Tax=Nitrosospira lacus TaxID=1288494 RepID=A0A1W6SST9_9PROT|nr:hydrogenase nickel incorporation protein HypA [Nitrosospira lacus]